MHEENIRLEPIQYLSLDDIKKLLEQYDDYYRHFLIEDECPLAHEKEPMSFDRQHSEVIEKQDTMMSQLQMILETFGQNNILRTIKEQARQDHLQQRLKPSILNLGAPDHPIPFVQYLRNTAITPEAILTPTDAQVKEMLFLYAIHYEDNLKLLDTKNPSEQEKQRMLILEGEMQVQEEVLQLLGQANSIEEIQNAVRQKRLMAEEKKYAATEITGDMVIGPYFLPIKLLLAAESMLYVAQTANTDFAPSYYAALLCMLERIIDASRNMVEHGSAGKFPEHRRMVELHLGNLRVALHDYMKRCSNEEVAKELQSKMEQMIHHISHATESQGS